MRRIVLGREGLQYLRSSLDPEHGNGNGLGKEAVAAIGEGGQVLTWLPERLDIANVSLEYGFRREEEPAEDLWTPLRDMVRQFLAADAKHIAVVECLLTKPIENLPGWLRSSGFPDELPYFFCNGGTGTIVEAGAQVDVSSLVSVFGFLTGTGTTDAQVEQLMDEAIPWHRVCVVSCLPRGMAIESGQQLKRSFLKELVSRAEHVAAGAFDGSGVVVWKRSAEL